MGYLLNNMVEEKCTPILEAANSLITATTAKEEDLSTLSATHAAYTAQTQKLEYIIDQLKKDIFELKEAATKRRQRPPRKDRGRYCWTHGYLVAPHHTSKTCKSKKPGHQDDATREDNKGGSQYGKPTGS